MFVVDVSLSVAAPLTAIFSGDVYAPLFRHHR